MRSSAVLSFLAVFLLAGVSAQAQNLLVDGDFSVNPGSGSGGSINSQGGGSYQYVLANNGGNSPNGGLVTGVGGAGGWSVQNGGSLTGSTGQPGSAVYFVNTAANPDSWIPNASASNTNAYVVQLDTISTATTWSTGNAIYQTVNVTAGQSYSLSFLINTETGGTKSNLSGADVMVTNATITSSAGSAGTVLTSSATNKNAASYGNVTGYQYTVDTTGQANGATTTTWAAYTMTFTATGSTVQIAFADDPISANSNISLESVSLTSVPEPREWGALVLIGAMMLAGFRKLRAQFVPVRAF